MNVFWHNPIADMEGPLFLGVYFAVVVIAIAGTRLVRFFLDTSLELGIPEVPATPDPYSLAYLSGGANQVIRVLVFELIDRGLFIRTGVTKDRLVAVQGVDTSSLSNLQRDVYQYFETERTPRQLFSSGGLRQDLSDFLSAIELQLQDEQLIRSRFSIMMGYLTAALVALSLAAFGGYKLSIALSRGKHNVAFLIFLMVVAVYCSFYFLPPTRITRRGNRYLDSLKLAFRDLRTAQGDARSTSSLPPDFGSTIGLTVALFGVSVLAGSMLADYRSMFAQSMAGSYGTWGTGCGMNSCGGSSCGGGGGCGGGGCGGCGGGD